MSKSKKKKHPEKTDKKNPGDYVIVALTGLFLSMAALVILSSLLNFKKIKDDVPDYDFIYNSTPPLTDPVVPTSTDGKTFDPPNPTAAVKDSIITTATIGVTGDVIPHVPMLNAAKAAGSKGEYDFSQMLQYVAPYYQKYDFMVANLETSLGGEEAGAYNSFPNLNSPDSIVDALKTAGVDMVLTANTRSYDCGDNGLIRTQKVLNSKGMLYLGTQMKAEDADYKIQNINGIQVGMLCYTYETPGNASGRKYINGKKLSENVAPLVSTFHYGKKDAFYADISYQLEAMENAGAEFTIVFMHWGTEFETSPSEDQRLIAQKLCELGVDVIIGSHPHVVQPFTVLSAENGNTTYCLYSIGNALTNYDRNVLKDTKNNTYTEDGMIFGLTLQKWNDGTVEIADISVIPTWVSKKQTEEYSIYRVIPLDTEISWSEFPVDTPTLLTESYNRTMSLVGGPLNLCRKLLNQPPVPTNIAE